jgi:acyl carrier protein
MNSEKLKQLEKIFKNTMRTKEFRDDLSMSTMTSWDSLKHVEFLTEIEEQFGINIDIQDIMKMTDVLSIKQVLAKYL